MLDGYLWCDSTDEPFAFCSPAPFKIDVVNEQFTFIHSNVLHDFPGSASTRGNNLPFKYAVWGYSLVFVENRLVFLTCGFVFRFGSEESQIREFLSDLVISSYDVVYIGGWHVAVLVKKYDVGGICMINDLLESNILGFCNPLILMKWDIVHQPHILLFESTFL